MLRSLKSRLALGLLAVLVFLGGAYASKPLGCGGIKHYGSYEESHDALLAYGGGPEKSILRINALKEPYGRGALQIPLLILTGTQVEVELMEMEGKKWLPSERIRRADPYSINTTQNITTGYKTVRHLTGKDDPKIGNVVSKGQGARVEMIIKKERLDGKGDDRTFPVKDGYGNRILTVPFGDSDIREYIACGATRFSLVK